MKSRNQQPRRKKFTTSSKYRAVLFKNMPAPTALLRRPEELAEAARVPLPPDGGLNKLMNVKTC
jgi:hypothetical protein